MQADQTDNFNFILEEWEATKAELAYSRKEVPILRQQLDQEQAGQKKKSKIQDGLRFLNSECNSLSLVEAPVRDFLEEEVQDTNEKEGEFPSD